VTDRAERLDPNACERGQPFRRAERSLLEAEQAIRLIDRSAPVNLAAERARLLDELRTGGSGEPCFVYAARPDLSALRRALEELARELELTGELGRLYAERALELESEAALVAALGTPRFAELARERYAPERFATAEDTEALLEAWGSEVFEDDSSDELIRADDGRHPRSLTNVLHARIGELGVPVRVELRASISTLAAAGDGFVAIRPEARLTATEAERIAAHELLAHVLPRIRARSEENGLFRVGPRSSGDEEEGRALLIEERLGFFDAPRRRELALRHELSRQAREGARFPELVRCARERGVRLERAVDLGLRTLRGGGLGRELVYLPAYSWVRQTFAQDRHLEHFFERGRMSVAAARVLSGAKDDSELADSDVG
jgi:hypothetical protein